MSYGHIVDQRRFEIEEPMLRYRSHANACEQNAAASKNETFILMNNERAKQWHARADEMAAKLAAYDAERAGK